MAVSNRASCSIEAPASGLRALAHGRALRRLEPRPPIEAGDDPAAPPNGGLEGFAGRPEHEVTQRARRRLPVPEVRIGRLEDRHEVGEGAQAIGVARGSRHSRPSTRLAKSSMSAWWWIAISSSPPMWPASNHSMSTG